MIVAQLYFYITDVKYSLTVVCGGFILRKQRENTALPLSLTDTENIGVLDGVGFNGP